MTDLILIIVAAVLVNNFVLTRFLGLCPFLGAGLKQALDRAGQLAQQADYPLALEPDGGDIGPHTTLSTRVQAVAPQLVGIGKAPV